MSSDNRGCYLVLALVAGFALLGCLLGWGAVQRMGALGMGQKLTILYGGICYGGTAIATVAVYWWYYGEGEGDE